MNLIIKITGIMEKNFDYNSVPYDFVHCLNSTCPYADKCLRYLVAKHIPVKCKTVTVINPYFIPTQGEVCPDFKEDKKERFALGLKHLLDNVPHSDAVDIKRQILKRYKKNMYYRSLNKERWITPEEQNYIRGLFIQKGIKEEPIYEKYAERYVW